MYPIIAGVAKQSRTRQINGLQIASSLRSSVTAPASPEAPAFGALPPAWPRPVSISPSPCSRRNGELIRVSLITF